MLFFILFYIEIFNSYLYFPIIFDFNIKYNVAVYFDSSFIFVNDYDGNYDGIFDGEIKRNYLPCSCLHRRSKSNSTIS
jgi:hypothetical protein